MMDCQYSNARSKMNKESIDIVFKTKNFLIEVWIEEMKPVVVGDRWGWVWESRKKSSEDVVSGNFELSGFWCNEQNQRFFNSALLHSLHAIDWVLNAGIRTCIGWAIQVWILSERSKSSTFWKFRTVRTLTQSTNWQFSRRKIFYN